MKVMSYKSQYVISINFEIVKFILLEETKKTIYNFFYNFYASINFIIFNFNKLHKILFI